MFNKIVCRLFKSQTKGMTVIGLLVLLGNLFTLLNLDELLEGFTKMIAPDFEFVGETVAESMFFVIAIICISGLFYSIYKYDLETSLITGCIAMLSVISLIVVIPAWLYIYFSFLIALGIARFVIWFAGRNKHEIQENR